VASGQEFDETERAGAPLAFVLAWVGGVVDAIGFLTLNRLFTAHMSGNSAAFGAYLGQGGWAEAARRATPIPLFVLGVALGDAVIEIARRRGIRATRSVALTLEAVLLIAFRVYAGGHLDHGEIAAGAAWRFTLLVGLLAVPMGLQTAALQRVGGGTVQTTFITGMLTNLAKEVVTYLFWLSDRHRARRAGTAAATARHPSRARALLMAGIWAGFVVGATTGGVAVGRWGLNAVVAPLLVLGAVIVRDARQPPVAPPPDPLAPGGK
jgi:uncharacterized membrane protein YoaK (UPF0700 family)